MPRSARVLRSTSRAAFVCIIGFALPHIMALGPCDAALEIDVWPTDGDHRTDGRR